MTRSGFGDIDKHQTAKAFEKRFLAIVPALQALDQNYYYKRDIQRFRDLLNLTTRDLGVLPIFSKDGLSPVNIKSNCTEYLVSAFVQDYWKFCDTDSTCYSVQVEVKLKRLESIANKGFEFFDIWGSKHPGYYLLGKV